MEPEKIIIGIIIFGLMISSGMFFLSDLSSDFITVDKDGLEELNKIEKLNNDIIQPMQNQTNNADGPDEGVITTGMRLSSGVYSALKYVFALPTILASMLDIISGHLGIPTYIINGITLIITVITTFFIVKFIFGRK